MPTAAQAAETLKRRRLLGGQAEEPEEPEEPEEKPEKEDEPELEEPEAGEPKGRVHWSESNTTEIQKRRKERYGY